MTRNWKSLHRLAAAGLLLAGLAAPAAWAHPRFWRHHHRHHRRAVIVIGAARPIRHTVVVGALPHGALDMNVKPATTEVWVDGKFRGTADDFDGSPQKLQLAPGTHRLKLVTPEGEEYAREIQVTAGAEVDIDLKFED